MTVAKLSGARDPKRALTGRWEGPPPIAEQLTEVVALAKELRHYPINKRKRSLRDISAELMKAEALKRNGTAYTATAVAKMIA
jgi:hypothetical protein